MTFAVSAALGQEAIGVRMEFLARSAAIRADALVRLQKGENPITVAQGLTDGVNVIDIFAMDVVDFANMLDALLGQGPGAQYTAAVGALAPLQQDTPNNRQHVLNFWQPKINNNPVLADQIRNVFIQALQAAQADPNQDPVQVRWGQPAVTRNVPGIAMYANGEVVMTVDPPKP